MAMNQLAFHISEAWLPDNFKMWLLTEDELKVYEALHYHQGKDAAITIRELGYEAFPMRPFGALTVRDRIIRDVLKQLTEKHKIAIGASCQKPYGVFLLCTPDELLGYVANLTARATSMLRRAASLKKVSLPAFLGQLRVDLESEDQLA